MVFRRLTMVRKLQKLRVAELGTEPLQPKKQPHNTRMGRQFHARRDAAAAHSDEARERFPSRFGMSPSQRDDMFKRQEREEHELMHGDSGYFSSRDGIRDDMRRFQRDNRWRHQTGGRRSGGTTQRAPSAQSERERYWRERDQRELDGA